MKRKFVFIILLLLQVVSIMAQPATYFWTSPSKNSSESMPCGGGDIGLNVWVENGDLLFYVSRSGAFDENNTLLKQGRFRVSLESEPFVEADDFRQELILSDGSVRIFAGNVIMSLWVDVFHPVVHVEMKSKNKERLIVAYENWRYRDRVLAKGEGQQTSYKWAPPKGVMTFRDFIEVENDNLFFYHRNRNYTVFDYAVKQQQLEGVKKELMNPLVNLTSGGCFWGDNLVFKDTLCNEYAGTDYKSWRFETKTPKKEDSFIIALNISQAENVGIWKKELSDICKNINTKTDKRNTVNWWKQFWNRSFIEADGEAYELTRNYTLFRYMLGCNAYGKYPTKFNGGLFTFDPCFVDSKQSFTPDYRKWGGGTMTAQNQRLVYWPMLKSGDWDMMFSQFETYYRMLSNAELRSKVYWKHSGACFTEQLENFGLPNPAEYGYKRPSDFDSGMEFNSWLEYEWDTVLEFCAMMLEVGNYSGLDISKYFTFIESVVTFFDEHYRLLAQKRGSKELDSEGKLILYPGSACETYKMTYNASSTIAGLKRVLQMYGRMKAVEKRIPDIPLRIIDDKKMISPAIVWERINNIETPQLYPVFPWRFYGVGRDNLDVALNTYLYDKDAIRFRSHIGWKQDNIWAACLGLTEEAARLNKMKLSASTLRFPAFWGPGYDWTPDHNWGGSGMIGIQEMLLQTVGDKICLFPAWPADWNVHFKLHASKQTVIEAELKDGKVNIINVTPSDRIKDIEVMIKK